MKGERVVVRDYKGRPLLRLVWEDAGKIVYIINNEQYQRLMAGEEALGPIGFPREDVFKFSPTIKESIDSLWNEGKWQWEKQTKY